MIYPTRITTRNATFQQWQALLTNRTKRTRSGAFVVQGVQPITLALAREWPLRAVLYNRDRRLSSWARDVLDGAGAPVVGMASELLRDLGGKEEETPELVLIAAMPPDDLDRLLTGPSFLGVAFDRPKGPGNIGTLVRSLDAFGGSGLIVAGHAADPYDPAAIRASTGSMFAVPVVRVPSHDSVMEWVEGQRRAGLGIELIGTDEDGDTDLADCDLTGPVLIAIGNETAGLSAGWGASCDRTVRIPMAGTASSLNAATAGAIILYEAMRQRRSGR